MDPVALVVQHPLLSALSLIVGGVLAYAAYELYLSPLAKYPGPFWARLTTIWKAWHVMNFNLGEEMKAAHARYGPIIRIAPNQLSFATPEAIKETLGAGPSFEKTHYYDALQGFAPNMFSSLSEDFHRTRRRQFNHIYAQSSVLEMEPFMDEPMQAYRLAFDKASKSGKPIDVKEWNANLVVDAMWALAFGEPFGMTQHNDQSLAPPTAASLHIMVFSGQMPWSIQPLRRYGRYLPIAWFREGNAAFARVKSLGQEIVVRRYGKPSPDRKSILDHLLKAKDPQSGKPLTLQEVTTEAFSAVAAGTHTASTTLTFFLFNVLHSPRVLAKLIAELDSVLTPLSTPDAVYPYSAVEPSKLPYLYACIKENNRHSGVFDMPLPRVVPQGGRTIAGQFIPAGVEVAISNRAMHYNASFWGADVEEFRPERWQEDGADKLEVGYMPFSAGHRSCIGRNIAMTEMSKALATILRHYELTPVDKEEKLVRISVGIAEKKGGFPCYVRKRRV